MNRSYLFVPADSERKFGKAAASAADALILDLEDSVAPAAKPAARDRLCEFLAAGCGPECWVRINPLGTADCDLDLAALASGQAPLPTGIVLPKASGGDDLRRLDEAMSTLEYSAGAENRVTRIMPLVTERPAALFRLHEYAAPNERLAAMTWGAEDLAAAVGASANRDNRGRWLAPYELARSLCLFAAAAAEVPAVDTVFTDLRDSDGLVNFARAARRDGFSGMLLIHPAQIGPVHDAFTPTDEEIDGARQIVELFEQDTGTGVAARDGRMVDRPHYLQAQRLLAIARQSGKR